jgi:hypothetical protein
MDFVNELWDGYSFNWEATESHVRREVEGADAAWGLSLAMALELEAHLRHATQLEASQARLRANGKEPKRPQ